MLAPSVAMKLAWKKRRRSDQRGFAARGHVGTVTRGHAEMASEAGQRQLCRDAVPTLPGHSLGLRAGVFFSLHHAPRLISSSSGV